jgi:hypothetical protein
VTFLITILWIPIAFVVFIFGGVMICWERCLINNALDLFIFLLRYVLAFPILLSEKLVNLFPIAFDTPMLLGLIVMLSTSIFYAYVTLRLLTLDRKNFYRKRIFSLTLLVLVIDILYDMLSFAHIIERDYYSKITLSKVFLPIVLPILFYFSTVLKKKG